MRFSEGDYDHPGQWALWEQALYRAVNGQKGQQVLRDMEAALLALPEPKLIEAGLSDGKGVCAVGAFVAQRRVEAGEDREAVLEGLKRKGGWSDRYQIFKGWETEQGTIDQARAQGMQLSIACAVAGENDWHYGITDEEWYDRMLKWVRERIIEVPA